MYPQTLNPIFAEGESQWRVESLIFNGLLEIDPQTRLPVPALAAGFTASPDGLTYTFTLRENVKWHDGSPFTSADVVWTYSLLRDPTYQAPLAPYAALISKVTAPNARTVVFTLNAPYAAFPARLGTVPVIPRRPFAALKGNALRAGLLDWARPIGTGPFRFASADPGRAVRLEANRTYFRGAPLLDRYEFVVGRDPASTQEALTGGEIDVVWLPPSVAASLPEQDFLTRADVAAATTTLLFFNVDSSRPALADARVRQAVGKAVDGAKAAAAMGGELQASGEYQPPTSPAYPEPAAQPAPPDPAAAAGLLDAAGWRAAQPGGIRAKGKQPLALNLYLNRVPAGFPTMLGRSYLPLARQIQADLRAVGVDVRIHEEGWEQLARRLFTEHDFDLALLSMTPDADPDQSYIWASDSYTRGFNIGHYSSPLVDTLLKTALQQQATAQRLKAYAQLQTALASDLPAVPLGYSRMTVIQNNRLNGPGADYWSLLQHTGVEKWYVEDGR